MDTKVIFHPDTKLLKIDGVPYRPKRTKYKTIDGVQHEDCIIFEEFNPEMERKMEFIKDKIINELPKERIAEEVIKSMDDYAIEKIYKIFKTGKSVKVRRHDGCLGIHINGGKRKKAYIDIFP
jgi:hypothetical protein